MNRRTLLTVLGGATASWPLRVVSQAKESDKVIGFLSSRSVGDSLSVEAAFRDGLKESGNTVGNVRLDHRWADGHFDRLPALARELGRQQVSVIAAVGGEVSALAAKAATSTVPIVYDRSALAPSAESSLQRSTALPYATMLQKN